MTPDGILETVLYAGNLDEAERFYRDTLGLERIARDGQRHVFFRCGNQVLLIFNPAETLKPTEDGHLPIPPHGATGPGHVCFRATSADIDAWQRRLDAAGISVEADFEWPQGGRSIYFRDPAGNCLELAEPRIWGLEP